MDKVIHFEIPAGNLKRAQDFYQEVFGWVINPMPEMNYTIVMTGPTGKDGMAQETGFINGGMMERQADIKSPVITIGVADIDEAAKKITAHGGKMIRPKMDVGDMGWEAYFTDSEGNILGLWQNKNK
jgi:predicted enzyme related to lactoylglutathione lyase